MKHGLRIIAADANKLGDTLTLLSRDLFHTLGYEDCRFNVHKAGRELDVEATHCYENRRLVAECKATSEPIGGSDINKFVGALDAEKRKHAPTPVQGYFVSLSGFRQTAVEQELELGDRVTLIAGQDVVQRLSESAVVVPAEVAIERAAGLAARAPSNPRVLKVELLGHVDGWAWLVQLGADHPTHMCLVHADGRVLSAAAAAPLQEHLPDLVLLAADAVPALDLDHYKRYLLSEYGAITLEGMPVDHEVGSRNFRLESLYVPLQLRSVERLDEDAPGRTTGLGVLLGAEPRIAVLGPPGAGKTTILKRLAVAYADPARKLAADDALPDEDLLPVFIRCRHLSGGDGHKPITEIIGDLMVRAERPDQRQEFIEAVGKQLREGTVLLLVDGLDEISDTSERVSFVAQLRTFVARYPSIRLVVTSREVGFRAVAGAVAAICAPHRVAELSRDGVTQLVQAWHREVLGARAEVEQEAAELATSILASDRVVRLASNPLLLTTLLLVKRWVGQLPRKRTVLYQKAVEVLLMTWNVEGHQPIDQDEALPQLAYAAFTMMEAGATQVSAKELISLFLEARAAMPEIFAYTKTSVHDFIQRVEERSSLLVLSGHEVIDGALQPIYEFKHLTFQEYLAALAIANAWVPEDIRDFSAAQMLQAHLGDESWREVVPLTGVLIGRRATALVELLVTRLTNLSAGAPEQHALDRTTWEVDAWAIEDNLVDCLHDEVSVPPALVRSALEAVIECKASGEELGSPLHRLFDTRFAAPLRDLLNDSVLTSRKPMENYCYAFMEVATADVMGRTGSAENVCAHIVAGVRSEDLLDQCAAAGVLMNVAYMIDADGDSLHKSGELERLGFTGADLVIPTRLAAERFASGLPEAASMIFTWALVWCTPMLEIDDEMSAKVMVRALDDWLGSTDPDAQHFSSWLVGRLVETTSWLTCADWEGVFPQLATKWQELIAGEAETGRTEDQLRVLLTVAARLGGPWSNLEMIDMAETAVRQGVKSVADYFELAEALGVDHPAEWLSGLRPSASTE
ncbi:hypothetical protein BBK82_25525 [Lentzea guizhouensis]|uniref:NACHT domain-containing protein n=1 Tax=Lentzea guizhouensis TaxID=1586287 RepID=A0A1B2HMK1_9PSEU|nr:NACHT domain-containing protein [Lentzea guizhouensis]ANZ38931.1 hypothetical protein BBK82_25525 [Lentzea guizhouensis]